MVEFCVPPADDLLVSDSEDWFTVAVTIVIHRPNDRPNLSRPGTPVFTHPTVSPSFLHASVAAIFQHPPSTAEMQR